MWTVLCDLNFRLHTAVMRKDASNDSLERVRDRGQVTRRSASWNIVHAMDESAAGSGAQSIHRALTLLNLLGVMAHDRPGGVALADVAHVSGRPKASVHRVLNALVQLGYAERIEPTGRYRLGLQAQILGELAGQRTDPLIRLSSPSLVRIAELSEDTTFLTVRQGSFSVCARREEGFGEIRNNALSVGDRHPLGIGAGGLAILAALEDEEMAHVIEVNHEIMSRRYPRISPEVLHGIVDRTRRDGYALNEGLVAPGSWAVAVIINIPGRGPNAALSVASIEQRLTGARRDELVAVMKKEASLIEASLASEQDEEAPGEMAARVHPQSAQSPTTQVPRRSS